MAERTFLEVHLAPSERFVIPPPPFNGPGSSFPVKLEMLFAPSDNIWNHRCFQTEL